MRVRHTLKILAASLLFWLSGCMHLRPQSTVTGSLEKAPAFSLPDQNGQSVDLQALTAHGPTLVVFSRGAWCPFCRRHLAALAKDAGKFTEAGVTLVSISTDPPADSLTLAHDEHINFPLLSDADGAVARHYGVLLDGDHGGGPVAVPAVFLVQPDGAIAWSEVGQYPWSTASVSELLAHISQARGQGASQAAR